jgi:predicted lipoprotein with Yx(FWY)xxD motif
MNRKLVAAVSSAALAGSIVAAAVSGPAALGQGYDDYPTTTTATPSTTAKAATVKLGHSKIGTYLVNGSSRALYLFAKDTKNSSKCSGACAKAWPPLTTGGTPKAGSGVKKSLLGTITRSDGKKQVTYNGHPLYRYDDDKAAGQHHGQKLKEFGALWYVVKSNGNKLGGY